MNIQKFVPQSFWQEAESFLTLLSSRSNSANSLHSRIREYKPLYSIIVANNLPPGCPYEMLLTRREVGGCETPVWFKERAGGKIGSIVIKGAVSAIGNDQEWVGLLLSKIGSGKVSEPYYQFTRGIETIGDFRPNGNPVPKKTEIESLLSNLANHECWKDLGLPWKLKIKTYGANNYNSNTGQTEISRISELVWEGDSVRNSGNQAVRMDIIAGLTHLSEIKAGTRLGDYLQTLSPFLLSDFIHNIFNKSWENGNLWAEADAKVWFANQISPDFDKIYELGGWKDIELYNVSREGNSLWRMQAINSFPALLAACVDSDRSIVRWGNAEEEDSELNRDLWAKIDGGKPLITALSERLGLSTTAIKKFGNIKVTDLIGTGNYIIALETLVEIEKQGIEFQNEWWPTTGERLSREKQWRNLICILEGLDDNIAWNDRQTMGAVRPRPWSNPQHLMERVYKEYKLKENFYSFDTDMYDMIRAFSKNLLLPLLYDNVQFEQSYEEVLMMMLEKSYMGLPSIIETALTLHYSWRDLERLSSYWHEHLDSIQFGVEGNKLFWPALFENFTKDGYSVEVLNSAKSLVEEAENLKHCVNGYATSCANGTSHIVGIRDEKGKSTSTLEIAVVSTAYESKTVPWYEIVQHRGLKNCEPSPEDKLRANCLIQELREGKLPVNLEAVKKRKIKVKNFWPTLIGYDPVDHAARDGAFKAWSWIFPEEFQELEYKQWAEQSGVLSLVQKINSFQRECLQLKDAWTTHVY